MNEVEIHPVSAERLERALAAPQLRELRAHAETAKKLLQGRTVWNINSTARGGGVAEMLQPLIAYARGLGIEMRWLVIEGDPAFFQITKRIHNNLHGHPGDHGDLGRAEQQHYEAVFASIAAEFKKYLRARDIVICHDPQTAGLLSALREHECVTIWRSHVGDDVPGDLTERAWKFLLPYIRAADHYVFSREAYIPPHLERNKTSIIPPSIDPVSPKNQPMDTDTARTILVKTGIVEGPADGVEPLFLREDGSPSLVEHCADVIHLGRAPSWERRLVVQVSRWDHLKDPVGVMCGFASHFTEDNPISLILAGPNVAAVADDPEGGQVLDRVFVTWRELPHETRKHVHIVCLPMHDREENAAIVNALQRHAAVLVQKSLYEGFGLTVTEAMWKGKPVVASAVGGIQDQIEHEVHGLLLSDAKDLRTFGHLVERACCDIDLARRLGENARQRVEKEFLFSRHLVQYLDLFKKLLA